MSLFCVLYKKGKKRSDNCEKIVYIFTKTIDKFYVSGYNVLYIIVCRCLPFRR